jgi:hypothetical protein
VTPVGFFACYRPRNVRCESAMTEDRETWIAIGCVVAAALLLAAMAMAV